MVGLTNRSLVLLAVVCVGCGPKEQDLRGPANKDDVKPTFAGISLEDEQAFRASWVPKGEATEEQIRTLCVACHTFPEPSSLPRIAWDEEMRKAYRFIALAERPDWVVPDIEDTTAWFKERSLAWAEYSATLAEPAAPPTLEEPSSGQGFRRTDLDWPRDTRLSAIASIQSTEEKDRPEILLSDMATGKVWSIKNFRSPLLITERFRAAAPCRIRRCDLDQNSAVDFLVADLGEFSATDHDKGKLWWCRDDDSESSPLWKSSVLLEDVGRVADARPLDIDLDGDLDLVVAEFGFVETGGIHLLRRTGTDDDGTPLFDDELIDERYGTVDVPVADLNGDGWPDFVALITQEHELVEAFLNDQKGGFEKHTIADIESPTFGFSGLSIVDIDADGDLDAITTNGDTLDSGFPSPDHGISWWRNNGSFPFERINLARIPGCYAAELCDLDSDGDLDIAVVAYLDTSVTSSARPGTFKGVVWLEQQANGEFREHVLDARSTNHLCLHIIDWNRDGRPDILTGPASFKSGLFSALTVYVSGL